MGRIVIARRVERQVILVIAFAGLAGCSHRNDLEEQISQINEANAALQMEHARLEVELRDATSKLAAAEAAAVKAQSELDQSRTAMNSVAPAKGNENAPRNTVATPAPATPRSQFLAEAIKRGLIDSSAVEFAVGGETVRLGELDVHAEKIVRTNGRLDLFVTVKNVGAHHVFSPEQHPLHDQMRYPANSVFTDSYMNKTLLTLERGTQKLKPGEEATVHYSADIDIDAPFYLWGIYLKITNDDYSSLYMICSETDFQHGTTNE